MGVFALAEERRHMLKCCIPMPESLYTFTQEITLSSPWLLPLFFALLGACIGSFLNVVIYRMPRGMSINSPRRSFCPGCKAAIAWYHNIPLLSYLLLRGRSACCRTHISLRYWLVELACTLLFAGIARHFCAEDILTQLLLCLWGALMLAALCIDWEQMVVLPRLTLPATMAGIAVGLLSPWLLYEGLEPQAGLVSSLAGALGGFLIFRLVGMLGKLMFGRRSCTYTCATPWRLEQAPDGEDLHLTLGQEPPLRWSELFLEESHRLTLQQAVENTHAPTTPAGDINFTPDAMLLPDGTRIPLEEADFLEGHCHGYTTRREAMGSGDAWLAMAIGAACGWQGVIFALVGGSFIGLAAAAAARIRRGTPMPFGPALITAAFIWLFWGSRLWNLYLDWALG